MSCRDSGISLSLDKPLPNEPDACSPIAPPTRTSSREWDRRLKDSDGPVTTGTDKESYDKMTGLRTIYRGFWNRVGTVEAPGPDMRASIRKKVQQLNNLQLYDMSLGVYQELSKRENKKVAWLPSWMAASSARQGSENQLPQLNQQQFEHLMRDVMGEINRRFPDMNNNQKWTPEEDSHHQPSKTPIHVHLPGLDGATNDPSNRVMQDMWSTLLTPGETPKHEDKKDLGCHNNSIPYVNGKRPQDSVELTGDDDFIVLTESDTTHTDSAPGSKRSSFGTQEKKKLRLSGEMTAPDLTRSIEDLDKKVVADGGFSSVYTAEYKGKKVAVKVLRVTRDSVDRIRRRLNREILIWSQLDHPNITPLLGVAQCSELSSLQAMVTPWYEYSSASQYLARYKPSTFERLELATGVADGLQYLHRLLPVVVHADLKPNNILIDEQRRPRICDFGLSQMINEEAGSGFTTTTPHTGNARYAAYEIIFQEDGPFSPSTSSDVFSLGCVIYEFITGCLPYSKCTNLMQIVGAIAMGVKPATRPAENVGLSSVEGLSWDLFQQCWRMEPELRPRADEVWRRLQVIASVGSGWSPPLAVI